MRDVLAVKHDIQKKQEIHWLPTQKEMVENWSVLYWLTSMLLPNTLTPKLF